MSTETTPDLFRRAADAWVGDTEGDAHARCELRDRADRLELVERGYDQFDVPGLYPTIVVEQDGPTPGRTLREAASAKGQERPTNDPFVKDQIERIVNAVLAAYTAPTLTPVGEHPESGTRGLLPVVSTGVEWRTYADTDPPTYICGVRALMAEAILADPRSDGAE
jgi:hypothetical protein